MKEIYDELMKIADDWMRCPSIEIRDRVFAVAEKVWNINSERIYHAALRDNPYAKVDARKAVGEFREQLKPPEKKYCRAGCTKELPPEDFNTCTPDYLVLGFCSAECKFQYEQRESEK